MRPTVRRDAIALIGLCLGFFMLMLDSTIAVTAIRPIMLDTSASTTSVLWVNSGYLLGLAVPLLVAGRLGDRFGARSVFLGGLVVFTGASVLCACCTQLWAIVAWRVVQGVGAALMTPQCLALIRALFTPPRLAVALAAWGAVGGLASAVGPIVGGLLVVTAGWPTVFLVNAPIGVAAFVLVRRFVPETETMRSPLPIGQIVLATAGAFALVIGVQGVDADSPDVWRVPRIVWMAVGAVLIAGMLFSGRRSGASALVPLPLFRTRGFAPASLAAAAASFCVGSAAVPLMLWLQQERALSTFDAALAMVPMGFACAIAAPFAARLNNGAGPRATALIGAACLAGSVLTTAAGMRFGWPTGAIASVFTLFGVANAFVWSPLALVAVSVVAPGSIGAASAVFNALKQFGAVLGSAATAILLPLLGTGRTMAVLAAVVLVALGSAVRLPGRTPASAMRRAGGAAVPVTTASSPEPRGEGKDAHG